VLVDYTIKHHFSHLGETSIEKLYCFFLRKFQNALLKCAIIDWQRVTFVHAMNTDNMSILGLTIDFGPYGWSLEGFDLVDAKYNWTYKYKRYRYGNQPNMGFRNLYQLGKCFVSNN
jgi:uncharacterized protein YdiU (UPF0061 family)